MSKVNWSKAKTILIIAFLITNLMLAIVLFSEEKQEVSTIKESFIQDVIDILEKKDIYVNTEIPDEIPSLNTLTVKYEMLDHLDVNSRFFDGKGKVQKDTEKIIISKEDEIVTIENKKKLAYINNRENYGYEDLNRNNAKQMVFDFLEERGYDTSNTVLWRTTIEEDRENYIMQFSRMYNERYLENTYTNVVLDNKGVLYLERLWLEPVSEGETPIYINTAPKALLDLIGNSEVYGKTINNISLSYYFNPDEHEDYVEAPKETKEGKSIPAWRVTFEDGTKIIIDNY